MIPKNQIPEELKKPTEPGLYLRIFHGRNDPDQDLGDWGFDGPIIGPIQGIRYTYGNLSLILPQNFTDKEVALFVEKFKLEPSWPIEIKQQGDIVVWNDMYFGDMIVFYNEN